MQRGTVRVLNLVTGVPLWDGASTLCLFPEGAVAVAVAAAAAAVAVVVVVVTAAEKVAPVSVAMDRERGAAV